jgi:hypothetical protein
VARRCHDRRWSVSDVGARVVLEEQAAHGEDESRKGDQQ